MNDALIIKLVWPFVCQEDQPGSLCQSVYRETHLLLYVLSCDTESESESETHSIINLYFEFNLNCLNLFNNKKI
jgi:hypothetical protein